MNFRLQIDLADLVVWSLLAAVIWSVTANIIRAAFDVFIYQIRALAARNTAREDALRKLAEIRKAAEEASRAPQQIPSKAPPLVVIMPHDQNRN